MAEVTNPMVARDIAPVSEGDVRESAEKWVIPRAFSADKKLHLPGDEVDEPLCGSVAGACRTVAAETYPPGYRDICRNCRIAVALELDDPPKRDEPIEYTTRPRDSCAVCHGHLVDGECPWCTRLAEVGIE